MLGRGFGPEDEAEEAGHVVLLSDSFGSGGSAATVRRGTGRSR